MTPLCRAAGEGKPEAVLALLQKGAAISAQNINDQPPLHLACLYRRRSLGAVVDILRRWGADEAALDRDGDSPAALLDLSMEDDVNELDKCSQADIDRARLLLARAPADRAWRRRGWLVMLRARASRERAASSGGTSESRKVARREGGAAVVAAEEREQTDDDVGAASGDGRGSLRGAVGWLVGMEPEGVFRTVLKFL